ncbi:MAG: hypothetical protein SOW59_05000 [Corynebacterium sp.]|nr:hypothetical protein [Corynebacterium sp.]
MSMTTVSQPPEHVLAAFSAPSTGHSSPEKLGSPWDFGWKIGDTVFVRSTDLASWSAKAREKLSVTGARIVRPVRATDGRFSVAGWKANQFAPGNLARRIDETAALGLRWDEAATHAGEGEGALPKLPERTDVFARAEALAWQETGEGYRELTGGGNRVVGHADLLATTIYAGNNPPCIVDVFPTSVPRPIGYTTALAITDGLIAGAVDDGICDRFAHVPDIDQLLLRAIAYRRHVNNLHPQSQSFTRSNIERVETLLVSRARATM